eukprot:TRINITY_DN11239_c0_g3_i1.p1 TRINITY_DN11239_c0_g3~~TRINITY_DN11239_c0_g3_i1.p1  ORF type:complete len:115 (+),score=15.04 TRINITY_DN11239_c0_g3_i1:122-466(+)
MTVLIAPISRQAIFIVLLPLLLLQRTDAGGRRLDTEQCRALYATMDSGLEEVSETLFSPIVKYALLKGGSICELNWPRPGTCEGRRTVPPSAKRPAAEVDCTLDAESASIWMSL